MSSAPTSRCSCPDNELVDPTLRFAAQTQSLVANATLTGTLRIPDAAAPVDIVADLRAGRVTGRAVVVL